MILILLSLAALAAGNISEPLTKLPFPSEIDNAPILGLGVRKKGPIKVYAVGSYRYVNLARWRAPESMVKRGLLNLANTYICSKGIHQSLEGMCFACSAIKSFLGRSEEPTTFLLKMNMKVGGPKIANAIADSVGARVAGKVRTKRTMN